VFGEEVEEEIVQTLINRSGLQPSPVYVHPFCYEQEGHLVIAHDGLSNLFEPIDGALDWLAALQQPDGALLAFANGMDGFGEPRSDATAQAVRLWLLRDRHRYGEAISRALAFLAACQAPEGGIGYSPGSDDICSWSTMFTLQAVAWFHHEPRLDELL
jgi:prenyltransferase beta subunit